MNKITSSWVHRYISHQWIRKYESIICLHLVLSLVPPVFRIGVLSMVWANYTWYGCLMSNKKEYMSDRTTFRFLIGDWIYINQSVLALQNCAYSAHKRDCHSGLQSKKHQAPGGSNNSWFMKPCPQRHHH